MVQRPFRLEYALLGFLSDSPQHGYSIYQQLLLRSGLGQIWRLKQSQLYALLEKLEAAGLVDSQLQPQDPHPPRRVFSLTESGHLAYANWLTAPVDRPYQMRQEFFAKLYFCRRAGPVSVRTLANRQQQIALKWLADLEKQAHTQPDSASFGELLLQYRIAQVKTILCWLVECDLVDLSHGKQ